MLKVVLWNRWTFEHLLSTRHFWNRRFAYHELLLDT